MSALPHQTPAGAADALDETPPGRPVERPDSPDAPMMLTAEHAVGDPATMLACLVEDYARVGTPPETIRSLFRDPFFQATFGLRDLFGGDALERRVDAILARCGVFTVRVIEIAPAPGEPDDDEADLALCDTPEAPVASAACAECALAPRCPAPAAAPAHLHLPTGDSCHA